MAATERTYRRAAFALMGVAYVVAIVGLVLAAALGMRDGDGSSADAAPNASTATADAGGFVTAPNGGTALTQAGQQRVTGNATAPNALPPSDSQVVSVSEFVVPTHPKTHVWTCGADYGGIAPSDGSLSEWAPHYYIAHWYGSYGESILDMEPGDVVVVNGNAVTVQGSFAISQSSTYEEVMAVTGWDATVFQTCIPDTGFVRIVFARGASSTPAAALEAMRWAGM